MVKLASSWGLLDTIWQASANPFYQVFCPSTFLSVHPSIWYIFAQKVIEVWTSDICQLSLPNQILLSAKISIHLPKNSNKAMFSRMFVGILSPTIQWTLQNALHLLFRWLYLKRIEHNWARFNHSVSAYCSNSIHSCFFSYLFPSPASAKSSPHMSWPSWELL